MKAGLLFVLAHALVPYDQCREFGISTNKCGAVGTYAPENFGSLLAGYSYPILRDKSCESGHCLAHFYKNECEICGDDSCRRTCSEKKNNTKELLEFLKEVLMSRNKSSMSSQFEILNTTTHTNAVPKTVTITEQPSVSVTTTTATPSCATTSCPVPAQQTQAPAQQTQTPAQQIPGSQPVQQPAPVSTPEVTVYKTETKTVSIFETAKPESQRQPAPVSASVSQPGDSIPCTNPLSNGNECMRLIQLLQKSIPPRVDIKDQPKTPEPDCMPEEPTCASSKEPRKSQKKKKKHDASGDCESSHCLAPKAASSSSGPSPSAFSSSSDSIPASTSSAESRPASVSETYVTVTRTVDKTVTMENPITLFREYTTTVTKEKPLINYKVTTLTESSISVSTKTVTQTEFSEIRQESRSSASPSASKGGSGDAQPENVPQTVSVGCRDGSSCKNSPGSLDDLLSRCSQLAECREKLGSIPPELASVSRMYPQPPAAKSTAVPAPSAITKTERIPVTVTVVSSEATSSAKPPAQQEPRAVSSGEEQPDVYVTKTISVSVYRTLREDPDTETVYRTITKTAKHPTKTASRLSDEPKRGKKSVLYFKCDLNMSHCSPQGGDLPKKGGSGYAKTIINTIYSIKKSNGGDDADRTAGP